MSVRHAERFKVGDVVWWNVPTVMDHCRAWAPDTLKPVTIIAAEDRPSPNGVGHPQLVRVSPNYCPYGDEFSGDWFLPVGIRSHNDPAYRAMTTAPSDTQPGTQPRLPGEVKQSNQEKSE